MSLAERLADWADPKHYDPPGPSEGEPLRMLVYIAVGDFIVEHQQELIDWLLNSDKDEVPGLSEWVDEYDHRLMSEPSGYARVSE